MYLKTPQNSNKPPNRVVATGTSFKADMPFKGLATTEETKAVLHDWAKRIAAAKSIVVAGAGATGIEIAGELGQEYGVTGKKQITLISAEELPFDSEFRREVREAAKWELERLKVRVIPNAKVTSPPTSTTLTLASTSTSTKTANPATLKADLLIPSYGITPNTNFLPASMLDARGYVKQTTRLRAEGHANIFVVGDVGNLQRPQGVHGDAQVVHLARALLEKRLLGEAEGEDYKPTEKIMLATSIGRNRGTGQLGNWRMWSWLVWMLKGRHLGTNVAEDFVRGNRTMTAKSW